MTILICAQHMDFDPHIKYVYDYLVDELKQEVIYIERYLTDSFLSFSFESEKHSLILKNNLDQFQLKNIQSVYWRMKPVISAELSGGSFNMNEKFCATQWAAALRGIVAFYPDAKWLNHPFLSRESSNKISQLKVAQECGFKIPKTIVSNDAKQILTFIKAEKFIYKTIGTFITEKEAIFTNYISRQEISSNSREISMAPGIFQQFIEKDYELRVTFIDKEIFVLRINPKDKLDWRRDQSPEIFESWELDYLIKEKICQFAEIFGLTYGAFDFIVDKKGEVFFLECNPEGQWFFTEKMGKEIAIKVANFLSSNH